jgi:hypothetical protein
VPTLVLEPGDGSADTIGMFLRSKTRKKDGKERRYWSVVEHRRVADGRVVQRHVYPELPLTNNEAERALRHWVIARRIGMGTRTPQGTRVFALLASVIETCRKRGVSPWPYLAEVVRQRRKGLAAPPLPAVAV